MNHLDEFPSLQRFGEQLDELAARDAGRARRFAVQRLARRGVPGRLAPAVRFAAVLGAMTALIAGAYAVPATRAAVGDLYDSTLAHWFSGEGSTAPGRPAVAGEDLPDWLASEQALHGAGDARCGPIFGLVSASVTRIQLDYVDGTTPASQDHLDGAFGLTIQANRRPSSLTGYDETGRLVARKTFIADPRHASSVNDLAGDFGYCTGVAGCPPWLE
jgi:hypothetical protein